MSALPGGALEVPAFFESKGDKRGYFLERGRRGEVQAVRNSFYGPALKLRKSASASATKDLCRGVQSRRCPASQLKTS